MLKVREPLFLRQEMYMLVALLVGGVLNHLNAL